ncbi:hypothetical protein IG631_02020 [Alternaria alternata]|nr:hypothetical protein IG631_02020 [Alternaria alternata]
MASRRCMHATHHRRGQSGHAPRRRRRRGCRSLRHLASLPPCWAREKPCVHGSRTNSPIGRYRGLLERLCCPQCNAQALGNLHSEGALLDSASIPPTGKA